MRLEELEYRFQNLDEIPSFILAILSIAALAIKNVLYILLNGQEFLLSSPSFLAIYIGFPIIAASIAIVPHELAHRQVARHYGCLSRFTLSFTGFLATLIINAIPAPFLVFFSGYTLISCVFSVRDTRIDGITAAAGPIANIVIAFIALGIANSPISPVIAALFSYIAGFNAVVAFFNLLPFWVLDGLKVVRWNVGVWSILLILSLILLYATRQI